MGNIQTKKNDEISNKNELTNIHKWIVNSVNRNGYTEFRERLEGKSNRIELKRSNIFVLLHAKVDKIAANSGYIPKTSKNYYSHNINLLSAICLIDKVKEMNKTLNCYIESSDKSIYYKRETPFLYKTTGKYSLIDSCLSNSNIEENNSSLYSSKQNISNQSLNSEKVYVKQRIHKENKTIIKPSSAMNNKNTTYAKPLFKQNKTHEETNEEPIYEVSNTEII